MRNEKKKKGKAKRKENDGLSFVRHSHDFKDTGINILFCAV